MNDKDASMAVEMAALQQEQKDTAKMKALYEERSLTLNKEKAKLVKDNHALVADMNTLQEECTRLKTTMVRVDGLVRGATFSTAVF